MGVLTALAIAALLPGSPAAAQQPPAVSTAAAAGLLSTGTARTPDGLKYRPEIARLMKDLSLLLERGSELPPEKLEQLGPELTKFDLKVRGAIGDKILEENAAKEKEAEDRLLTDKALELLRSLRGALQTYYSAQGGKYPQDLAELATGYIAAVPEVAFPDHPATAAVKRIESRKYDKDYPGAVSDDGGWLYFPDRGSQNYGLLLLNCSHESPDGTRFYEY